MLKILERVSEDRMVAAFLKAEIDSPRWQGPILARLSVDNRPRSIVDCPDLGDASANEYRAQLLSFRGYRQQSLIFSCFPDDTQWQSAVIRNTDLGNVRVMNRAPWPEFSGGSRTVSDVAENFKSGRIDHEVQKEISGVLSKLREGTTLPELILVGEALGSDLVVMEGHVRATAILMSEHDQEIPVLIGTSANVSRWTFY